VPGSHGPKQSGSVIVPTDVPTHTSTISLTSTFIFFAGGGLLVPPLLSSDIDDNEFELDDDADGVELSDEVVESTAEVDVAADAEFCVFNVLVVLLAVDVGGLCCDCCC
jgi:hypothetical protein